MSYYSINRGSFNEEVINSDKPVFVAFVADWCTSSQTMNLVLEEFAVECVGRAKVCKLDVHKYADIASRVNVAGLPTIILFAQGAEVSRCSGLKSKEYFHEMISNLDK